MQLAAASPSLGGKIRNKSTACWIHERQKLAAGSCFALPANSSSFRCTYRAARRSAPSCLQPERSSSPRADFISPVARSSVVRRYPCTRTAKQAQQRQVSAHSTGSTGNRGSNEAVNTFSGSQQDVEGPTEAGIREIGVTVKVDDVNKKRPQVHALAASLLKHTQHICMCKPYAEAYASSDLQSPSH